MRRIMILFFSFLVSVVVEGGTLPGVSTMQDRLAEEVQKIVSAGHLAPAWFLQCYPTRVSNNPAEVWRLEDYWSNPAETIYTLAISTPFLSPGLLSAVKNYMQSEFNTYQPQTYVHSGVAGARREKSMYPTEWDLQMLSMSYFQLKDPQTQITGVFNPYNIYACWKYAQAMGLTAAESLNILNQVRNKIGNFPSSDAILRGEDGGPHILNSYIAGYYGYLGLQDLAGEARSATIQGYLSAALTKRVDLLADDPKIMEEREGGGFMFVVPELGDYLRQNASARVQQILDYQNWAAPYWHIEQAEEGTRDTNEGYCEQCTQYIYETLSQFQARALILKWPQDKLYKYLDAPMVYRGDLYYIQNLVYTLSAANSAPLTAAKVVVTANPGTIYADGSSQSAITASICDANGYVVALTSAVTFSLSSGSGSLSAPATKNAVNGIASITYTAGTVPGTAVITAASQGLAQGTVSVTLTAPPQPQITVLSPNGGESWQTGTNHTVTWTSTNISGNVDIEVSLGGITGPWATLVPDTSCDGSEVVTLPTTPTLSGRIRVKSVSGTPSDYSNSDFTLTVTPQPIVSVNPSSIDFGSIEQGQSGTNTFNITNTGAGTLSGTLTASQPWLTVTPATFSGNSAAVTVSVNTTGLSAGANSGNITLTTNGGTASVNITVNVTIPSGQDPHIALSTTSLNFGELDLGLLSEQQVFTIKNDGQGTLTGTISVSDSWITIDKTSLNLAAQAEEQVTVSVDNSVLAQKEGPAKGEITITSNGDNGSQVTTTISVEFTATCVLVKPNPVRLSSPLVGEGKGEGSITFFGDGIVPGQTKIIIYTLSGTVVADLSAPDNATAPMNGQLQNEITWQPSNLSPGIYIYVYASSKEKGIAKFTVMK